ncbi:hypothetical protein D3C87_1391490 [compost metagenome]
MHGVECLVQLRQHLVVQCLVLGADQFRQRGARHLRPVHAGIVAGIGRRDADRVVKMRIIGVVGEAIMLLFRIMQQKAELHAFAGQLTIGE